jgi:hypothetical protein
MLLLGPAFCLFGFGLDHEKEVRDEPLGLGTIFLPRPSFPIAEKNRFQFR